MTEQTAIIVSQEPTRFLAPVATIAQAIARYQLMGEFTKNVMRPDHDYGAVPGTDKPTLLKPGAEKLCSLFGLAPTFEAMTVILDVTGKDHEGEPFIYFQYRCAVYGGSNRIAEGIGSCNSWEKKYRYRNSDRLCPSCGKATIIKGKKDYGGGWLCFTKKGGCGAKFADTAPAIVEQVTGQIKNPDISDIINTLDKMAQKRAMVAATLIATNASDYFTQDMEDFTDYTNAVDVQAQEVTAAVAKPAQAAPTATQQPPTAPAQDEVKDNAPMTLEQACAVQNTEGKIYGGLPTDKLSYMANKLGKLANPTPENEKKLLAIQIILAERSNPA